jgi:glutathione peroxidase
MKKYFYSIIALIFFGAFIFSFTQVKLQKSQESVSFYSYTINSLDGKNVISMKDLKGKYILCVNVASECGYTPQYADLQKLADQYKEKLVVIGFPCNQFMGQEPGTSEQIENFCKKSYGITFPLSQKIDVKGDSKNEIYSWLTEKRLNGKSDATIKWNFNKILIDPQGNWLAYFPSSVKPMSEEIISFLK